MKKRKDCLFGMHFDFHASPDEKGLGGDFRAEDYEEMLDQVQPDVIQVDTKGHPGIASYPTKLGNAAPEMKGDMLSQLRAMTAERDVLLFAHYSGVWDMFQTGRHPEYRPVFRDVEYKGETSVFSAYADQLLIPQLKELAGEYGLDGAWVDGECWATQADYSEQALKAYRESRGEEADPEKDPQDFRDFCREAFFRYVRHYVEAVHQDYPDFEIASNWIATTFCPQKDDCGVDFITGDYDPDNSVNTARFQSRALIRCPKHWELLSWGFNVQNGWQAEKSPAQLKQEVSAVYHCGGTVSLYYTAVRGNIRSYLLPVWKEVADFSKQLGSELRGINVLPEIAVLQSAEGFYCGKKRLFSTWDDEYADDLFGVTTALADLGVGVEVAFTEVLQENISSYSAIVIPDFPDLEQGLKEQILGYVLKGGRLLLAGPNAVSLFAENLGLDLKLDCSEETILNGVERLGVRTAKAVLPEEGAKLWFYDRNFDGQKTFPALWMKNCGMGKIAVIPFAFGAQYMRNRGEMQLNYLRKALDLTGFQPFVWAEGNYKVDLVPGIKDETLFLNLLNLCGSHADKNVRSESFIPELRGVRVFLDSQKLHALLGGEKHQAVDPSGRIYPMEKQGNWLVIKEIDLEIQKTIKVRPLND